MPFTVPNALSALRIAGSGVLLWLAWSGHERAFVWLFVALVVTDWLDGKIAVLFDQRSVLGARLDSIGDALVYAILIVSLVWLQPDFLADHAVALAALVGSYLLSVAACLLRFGRLPAYHTRAAKTCWALASIGAICLFAEGPRWPARVAIAAVIITNAEAIAISFVMKQWRPDVPSIHHALRRARED